jgi:hypothetical protein
MVLWRTLLEGLADGVRSKAKSSAAGLGCLVQRGSVMALRSILIRHGSVFSVHQWDAILRETLLPAIQSAAENEVSPVIGITSESPHLSSIDFLADSLPIPPPPDDPGLKKFEQVAMANDRFVEYARVVVSLSMQCLTNIASSDLTALRSAPLERQS